MARGAIQPVCFLQPEMRNVRELNVPVLPGNRVLRNMPAFRCGPRFFDFFRHMAAPALALTLGTAEMRLDSRVRVAACALRVRGKFSLNTVRLKSMAESAIGPKSTGWIDARLRILVAGV